MWPRDMILMVGSKAEIIAWWRDVYVTFVKKRTTHQKASTGKGELSYVKGTSFMRGPGEAFGGVVKTWCVDMYYLVWVGS